MGKNSQHVVPKAEGGWSVRRTGAAKATRNFESQKDAVNFAKELARKQNGEVYIHGKDGTIRDRNSYGSGPMPPRDKK